MLDPTRTISTQNLHMHWYIWFCGIFWQGRSIYPNLWMLITLKPFDYTPRTPAHSFSENGRKKPPTIKLWILTCIGVSALSSKTPLSYFLPSPPLNRQTLQALPHLFLGNPPRLYWFFVNPRPKSPIFQWTSKILKFFILNIMLSFKSN